MKEPRQSRVNGPNMRDVSLIWRQCPSRPDYMLALWPGRHPGPVEHATASPQCLRLSLSLSSPACNSVAYATASPQCLTSSFLPHLQLGLPTVVPWTPWQDSRRQTGGYVVQYDGLTLATVRNAGHMVPYTQPGRSLDVLRAYLAGDLTMGRTSAHVEV